MGLFEAIFGKGAPKDDTAPKEAYYLSDDDAKTFGNIDYMRSSKTVRRTFAKKKGQTEHMESVRQISATKSTNVDGTSSSASNRGQAEYGVSQSSGSASAPQPKTVSSSNRRRPASSDMDMFRNMAKKVGK